MAAQRDIYSQIESIASAYAGVLDAVHNLIWPRNRKSPEKTSSNSNNANNNNKRHYPQSPTPQYGSYRHPSSFPRSDWEEDKDGGGGPRRIIEKEDEADKVIPDDALISREQRDHLAKRQWSSQCGWGRNTTATIGSPLYSCTNTFLTSAQFATRETNTLCTACPPGNVACTSSCCTEITTGSACVCPADLRGPTCNARIPFTCTPRLLAPTLSGCTNSGTRGGAASYEPGSDVDDANDNNACPRFGTTEAIEFRFEVACRQVQQLKVYLTPQSGGFTDGLFLYFLGDRDLFAYSNQPYVPQQFRLKFFNFFHPSDNSQAYFTPLDPPALALTGNKTFSITVNMSNVLAGGYQGAENEYAAGGRVYFEGGELRRML
ncbi:hypothetical protein PhCBS80983_g06245 [Powellomyces hirtus]|uniref:Uncharacterized protein n=1 Tax=Powellomyces hirtus TaxID=109895 RepID=A0A507DPL0_9FUNG|nr:hypothetical protein PhCBS80983_g06245 [Powellomyces hirtus]